MGLEGQAVVLVDDRVRDPSTVSGEQRGRWLEDVRREAERLRPAVETPPVEVPVDVLEKRGEASMTQAITYYFVEDPNGPGLAPTRAARLLGCRTWKTLQSALRGHRRHHPEAPRRSKPGRGGG